MFEKKKLWMVLAAASLVAACGGGSNGGGGDTGGGSTDGGGGGGVGGGGDNPPAVEYATLAGYSELRNQLYIGEGLVPLDAFQNARVFGRPAGDEVTAAAAPVSDFGFRLSNGVFGNEGGETVAGSFAIEFVERAGTEGIGTNEQAETMRVLVEGLEFSTGDVPADGGAPALSVTVPSTASLHISAVDSDGTPINETITNLPEGAVSIEAVEGDPFSVVLLFDFNALFGAATDGQRASLQPMADIRGVFDVNATLTPLEMRLPAAEGEEQGQVLEGAPITVGDNAAVTGSGVSGRIDVRMD